MSQRNITEEATMYQSTIPHYTGLVPPYDIDLRLPNIDEKAKLHVLSANAPIEITGARDDPEAALKNLLTALATLGLVTDSTTAS